jgi:HAD superfamily hydrolase (TIGR01490 family)
MKAAFFDVDGTLTETKVWNGLMDYFEEHRQRYWTNIFFKRVHYGLYLLYRLKLVSQVQFRETWAKNLSWYLRGYSLEEVANIWDWVVTQRISGQWRADILEWLKTHKADGDYVFLVSGGPEGLLQRIAQEVGADFVVGTRHVVENGFYTGKRPAYACQGENKARLVEKVIQEQQLDIDLSASSAYADSLGDLDLLEMVGNPVAVYPEELLEQVARKRQWVILGGAD